MTQLSPEGTSTFSDNTVHEHTDFRGDAPTTDEIIILGNDLVGVSTVREASENLEVSDVQVFNLENSARGLLERQSEDVATAAIVNPAMYPVMYEHFENLVAKAVDEGFLDLETDYPQLQPSERMLLYVQKTVQNSERLPADTLLQGVDVTKINPNVQAAIESFNNNKLKVEIERLKNEREQQQNVILELCRLASKNGATAEQMAEFYVAAKIATASEKELVENNKSLAERFRAIVGPLISNKALRLIGITAPRSAEITIVNK